MERSDAILDRLRTEKQLAANGGHPILANSFDLAIEEIERLLAIEKTAWNYFNHAVQDEAAERECCADDEQHRLAWELRDALNFPS